MNSELLQVPQQVPLPVPLLVWRVRLWIFLSALMMCAIYPPSPPPHIHTHRHFLPLLFCFSINDYSLLMNGTFPGNHGNSGVAAGSAAVLFCCCFFFHYFLKGWRAILAYLVNMCLCEYFYLNLKLIKYHNS